MKTIILSCMLLIAGLSISISSQAQESVNYTDRSPMEVEKIIQKAWEVVKVFGPEYYRPGARYDLMEFTYVPKEWNGAIQQYDGRPYHLISFYYDPSEEMFKELVLAEVSLWKDTGEPWEVTFGNGRDIFFLTHSFEEMKQMENHEVVPLELDTLFMQKYPERYHLRLKKK